jgi:hypothetical protein
MRPVPPLWELPQLPLANHGLDVYLGRFTDLRNGQGTLVLGDEPIVLV